MKIVNLSRAVAIDYCKLRTIFPDHELLKYLVETKDCFEPGDEYIDEFLQRFCPKFDDFAKRTDRNPEYYINLTMVIAMKNYYESLEKILEPYSELSMN